MNRDRKRYFFSWRGFRLDCFVFVFLMLMLADFLPASVIPLKAFNKNVAATVSSTNISNSNLQLLDPCLGTKWMVAVDVDHRGWPPHLVPMVGDRPSRLGGLQQPMVQTETRSGNSFSRASANSVGIRKETAQVLIVRYGEFIVVDQKSPSFDASFEAEALGSATVGQMLKVRLKQGTGFGVSGTVITVRVTRSGHAAWTTVVNEDGQ